MIGGSAGFKMIIAFPLSAPPTTSTAFEVVSVNSSIFARVPGPADLLEIVATISPYTTLDTRLIAATIGIVACPPQVIILILLLSKCSSTFTAGDT